MRREEPNPDSRNAATDGGSLVPGPRCQKIAELYRQHEKSLLRMLVVRVGSMEQARTSRMKHTPTPLSGSTGSGEFSGRLPLEDCSEYRERSVACAKISGRAQFSPGEGALPSAPSPEHYAWRANGSKSFSVRWRTFRQMSQGIYLKDL